MTQPAARFKPVLVLASRTTDDLRQVETALYGAGYRVVTARTERDAIQKVRAHQPDAVVLDRELTGTAYALCRTLREDPALSPAAPILVTQETVPTRAERIDALRAGVWNVGEYPPDPDELLLRLRVLLEPKAEFDQISAECLIDRPSGLYNAQGFAQRSAELAALTNRQGSPAACAVFRPAAELPTRDAADRLGRAFRSVGRLSDAIGRTADTEFAVFAPATHDWAAARLVRRMRDTVTQEVGYVSEQGTRITLRATYSAALPGHKVEPHSLLQRARTALEV